MENDRQITVGVIFPRKKLSHLRDILHKTDPFVRFVLIDLLDEDLKTPQDIVKRYGNLDVILHKLVHDMVFARMGDTMAQKRLELMRAFARDYRQIQIVDLIENVEILTNRKRVCEMLEGLTKKENKVPFCVPYFYVASSGADVAAKVEKHEIALPLIVKSLDACATEASHSMQIITKRSEIVELDTELLYQGFLNHSGRLYKGYVLGETIYIAQRPSLANFTKDTTGLVFDTQLEYPNIQNGQFMEEKISDILHSDISCIGKAIQRHLNITLFGFDVIIDEETSNYYVIDVNYFPSYKEVEDFDAALRQHMIRCCKNVI